MSKAQVITFPAGSKKAPRRSRPRNTDGIKYFNVLQIRLLRRTVRDQAELDLKRGKVTAVREWIAVDLISASGLRVAEAANVRCGDVKVAYAESSLFVREGKASRSRTVQIPESLKKHLKQFISWKASRGEPTRPDDYLFLGQRGPWTSQAIQQAVKKYLQRLGLYEHGKSVHALRHSYALQLYSRQRDLRAVQKQLGHSCITTTTVYADVTNEMIQRQLRNLW